MAVMAIATLVFQALPLITSGLVVSKQAPIPAEQPTMAPVPPLPPLGGVYCRGTGCRYRQAPAMGAPPPLPPAAPMAAEGMPPPEPGAPAPLAAGAAPGSMDAAAQAAAQLAEWTAKQNLAMGMDVLLGQKEFCRGIGCIRGMGKPSDQSIAIFNAQCKHYFDTSGLGGSDRYRSRSQVREAFYLGCKPKVGNSESVFCPAYADSWVGALYSVAPGESVGSVEKICTDMAVWIGETRQAEIDLRLWEPVIDGNAVADGDVGSNSVRGIAWKKHAQRAGDYSLLWLRELTTPIPNRTDPVEISSGSFDGLVAPVKVSAKAFGFCEAQMDEVMMHQRASGGSVVRLLQDWCNWQALERGKFGRPELTVDSCARLGRIAAFAFRNIPDPPPPDQPQEVTYGMPPKPVFGQPSPTMPPPFNLMPAAELLEPQPLGTTGLIHPTLSPEESIRLTTEDRFMLNPSQVCQQLFVAVGAIHRTERLLIHSFTTGARKSTLAGPMPPGPDDAGLIAMAAAIQAKLKVITAAQKLEEHLQNTMASVKNFADFVPTPRPEDYDDSSIMQMPNSANFVPQVKR